MNRVVFSSQTAEHSTPPALKAQLYQEFRLDYDPCPLNGTVDGLSTLLAPWNGRRVFCNPPYGPGIRDWLMRAPDADVAVYLLPARVDTRWFHELVLPVAKEIRFIKGRLKFSGAKFNAPFPSMVVIYATL